MSTLQAADKQLASEKSKTKINFKTVEDLIFKPEYRISAQWKAVQNGRIPARLSAQVDQLNVSTGQRVKKGDVLIELDCENAQVKQELAVAELDRAQAQLAFDQREQQRSQKLKQKGSAGEAEVDARKTAVLIDQSRVSSAKANLALANRGVDYCVVTAPYNGYITERLVSEGDWVNVGQAVVHLLGSEQGELIAYLPVDLNDNFSGAGDYQFKAGQNVYPAQLKSRIPQIEMAARSQKVVFDLVGQEQPLFGLSGDLIWKSAQEYLPSSLIQIRRGKKGLFTLKGCTVHFVELDTDFGRPIKNTFSLDTKIPWAGKEGLVDQQCVDAEPAL